MDDPFAPERSPDGRIEVRFNAYDVRMGHWILEPTVVRLRDGAVVMTLDGSTWDGMGPSFPATNQVRLALRHYPDGSKVYPLVVDVEAERCWLAGAEDRAVPAREAIRLLEPARQGHVESTAPDRLAEGFCPDCGAQLYGGLLGRLRRPREVECLVCGRRWRVPRGARLF